MTKLDLINRMRIELAAASERKPVTTAEILRDNLRRLNALTARAIAMGASHD